MSNVLLTTESALYEMCDCDGGDWYSQATLSYSMCGLCRGTGRRLRHTVTVQSATLPAVKCKSCKGHGAVQIGPNIKGIKTCPVCKGKKAWPLREGDQVTLAVPCHAGCTRLGCDAEHRWPVVDGTVASIVKCDVAKSDQSSPDGMVFVFDHYAITVVTNGDGRP